MKRIVFSGLVATAAFALAGLSSAAASDGHQCHARPGQVALDDAALDRVVSAAGLRRLTRWEREDGCRETRARMQDGREVDLVVDPYAGTILHREAERSEGRSRDSDGQHRRDRR